MRPERRNTDSDIWQRLEDCSRDRSKNKEKMIDVNWVLQMESEASGIDRRTVSVPA